MKKFLFVDLDDTLFHSVGKCDADDELQAAAFLKDGSACSFTNARQRAFIAWTQEGMTLIPTTARNLNAYKRVDLPFHHYAVLNYGGVILTPDGTTDQAWMQIMQTDMHSALRGLREIMSVMDDYAKSAGLGGRARLIEDFDIPFYVVMKDPEKVASHLEQVERNAVTPWLLSAAGSDFFVHRNGNNLAILPKALNKARAVAHLHDRLRAEYGPIMTFGMGDSTSDARFMAACDYAIVPKGSQLASVALECL